MFSQIQWKEDKSFRNHQTLRLHRLSQLYFWLCRVCLDTWAPLRRRGQALSAAGGGLLAAAALAAALGVGVILAVRGVRGWGARA